MAVHGTQTPSGVVLCFLAPTQVRRGSVEPASQRAANEQSNRLPEPETGNPNRSCHGNEAQSDASSRRVREGCP